MKDYAEMNIAQNLFLTGNLEDEEGNLVFIFRQGTVSETAETININNVEIEDCHQIYIEEDAPTYKVTFEWYVAYNILNESYDNLQGNEYTGRFVRIYSGSNYLDYIKRDSLVNQIIQKPLKHFVFVSANHIVSVVSEMDPIIEKIKEKT